MGGWPTVVFDVQASLDPSRTSASLLLQSSTIPFVRNHFCLFACLFALNMCLLASFVNSYTGMLTSSVPFPSFGHFSYHLQSPLFQPVGLQAMQILPVQEPSILLTILSVFPCLFYRSAVSFLLRKGKVLDTTYQVLANIALHDDFLMLCQHFLLFCFNCY